MASLGALVIELQANSARLSGDLGKGVAMIQNFAGKAKSALGVLGLGGGAGLLGSLAKDAISLGDELGKGAQRAGIAAGTFSELAAAAKQSDVSIESLSKGLKSMQTFISEAANGGKEAGDALFQLGVNLDDIRRMKADQQLRVFADALKAVPDDADRTAMGVKVLGKAYLDLVPAIADGSRALDNAIDAQKKLGNTFSDDQIKKLGDADDSIKKLSASWNGFATTLTAAVAPALTKVFDLLAQGSGPASVATLRTRVAGYDPVAAKSNPEYLALKKQLEEAEHQQRLAAIDARPVVSRGAIGPNALAAARAQTLRDAEERKKRQADALREAKTFQAELDAAQRAHANDKLTDAGGFNLIDPDVLQNTRTDFTDTLDYLKTSNEDTLTAMSKQFKDSGLVDSARAAAEGVQSAFADFLFDPFKDGLKGLLRGMVDVFRKVIAQAIALKAQIALLGSLDAKGNFSGGLLSGVLNGITGSIFGGPKAAGGPVRGGTPYLVGEKGPEIFSPGSSGTIIPNSRIGGGGVVVNQSNNFTGMTIEQANAMMARNNRELIRGIQRAQSANGQPVVAF